MFRFLMYAILFLLGYRYVKHLFGQSSKPLEKQEGDISIHREDDNTDDGEFIEYEEVE